MAGIEGVGNLKHSAVRPLRSTAKARDTAPEDGGKFSLPGQNSEGGNATPLRQSVQNGRHAPKSYSQKSDLPVEEQISQLKKIRQSSIQYEAVLMDEMVKQMRQSPLAKTPGGDTFSDIAEQPFRDFLSQAGGLGLADTITSQVARQQGLEQTLQDHPEIMGPSWRPTIPPNLMHKKAGSLEIKDQSEITGPVPEPETSLVSPQSSPDSPEKTAAKGLMTPEEIAWLYQDANEDLA